MFFPSHFCLYTLHLFQPHTVIPATETPLHTCVARVRLFEFFALNQLVHLASHILEKVIDSTALLGGDLVALGVYHLCIHRRIRKTDDDLVSEVNLVAA